MVGPERTFDNILNAALQYADRRYRQTEKNGGVQPQIV
jgi:hypothetical protein